MKEREEKLINKDNERLTWEQIVEKYPHQLAGLVDMELNKPPEPLIKSAVVKCTSLDTTEEEISRLASTEEIFFTYTSLEAGDFMEIPTQLWFGCNDEENK